jgi:hypothetical protein
VVSTDQIVLAGLAGNDTFRLNFNPLSSNGQLTPIRIEGGESGQFSDSAEFLPTLNAADNGRSGCIHNCLHVRQSSNFHRA